MAVTKIGYEKFPMKFIGDPNTALINYRARDTRTPYEQYADGEKWIYVDLRDFFPNEKPYAISREGSYDKFLHPRHSEYMRSVSKYSKLNLRMDWHEHV